jgi:predicted DNA-binding ribbon-helix-helix protein
MELDNKILETVEASIYIQLSQLKRRNIVVGDKKTSVLLEPLFWEKLHNIADQQGYHINELCTFIESRKNSEASLASAMRVFVTAYLTVEVGRQQQQDLIKAQ